MYTTFSFSYFDYVTESVYSIEASVFEQAPHMGSSCWAASDMDYFGYLDIADINVYDEQGGESILHLSDEELENLVVREWEIYKDLCNDY